MRRLAWAGCWVVLGLTGCGDDSAEAPASETSGGSDSTGSEASEPFESSGLPGTATEPGTTAWGESTDDSTSSLDDDTGRTTTSTSSTSTSSFTTADDTTTESTGGESTGGESTGGESTGEGGETTESSTGDEPVEDVEFPPAQPFGDNIQELDLVGVWGLNWNPASGWDSELTIDEEGAFLWRETSADCADTFTSTGALWVEGVQVVMHVDQWDGALPWDTEEGLDRRFAAPFRMRLSFTLQGDVNNAYLAFSGPEGLTRSAPYTGESYVQLATLGEHLGGEWRGEAELWAGYDGPQAEVIVRDVSTATTEVEADPEDPEATGSWGRVRTYFPVPSSFYAYANFNWTCLDGCPDPAGTTYIAGTNLYTYGPYAGYQHLMPFESGRAFRRGVVSDCQ